MLRDRHYQTQNDFVIIDKDLSSVTLQRFSSAIRGVCIIRVYLILIYIYPCLEPVFGAEIPISVNYVRITSNLSNHH